jgi:hypothetical protein
MSMHLLTNRLRNMNLNDGGPTIQTLLCNVMVTYLCHVLLFPSRRFIGVSLAIV